MATPKAGSATAKKAVKKSAPKKSAAKKSSKKASTKKTNKAEDAAPAEPVQTVRPAGAKMEAKKEKSIAEHKKDVWDTLNVPRDRRGENLHEQNPDLQASINSRTVSDLDKKK